MPTEAARGRISLTTEYHENWVASSAEFRRIVGAATVDEAKEHIYWQEASDKKEEDTPPGEWRVEDRRPRAIINYRPGSTRSRMGPGQWNGDALVEISFEFAPPKEYVAFKEQARWFMNVVGTILDEMENSTGVNDGVNPNFAAREYVIVDGPMPCDDDEEGEYFWGLTIRPTGYTN